MEPPEAREVRTLVQRTLRITPVSFAVRIDTAGPVCRVEPSGYLRHSRSSRTASKAAGHVKKSTLDVEAHNSGTWLQPTLQTSLQPVGRITYLKIADDGRERQPASSD